MSWADLMGRIEQARNGHQRAGELFSNAKETEGGDIEERAVETKNDKDADLEQSLQEAASKHPLGEVGAEKLREDLDKYGQGNFPPHYYEEFARHLYKEVLERNGGNPAAAMAELNQLFVDNNGASPLSPGYKGGDPDLEPLLEAYNQAVRTDDSDGHDKIKHFIGSAYLEHKYGGAVAWTFGHGKEIENEIGEWMGRREDGSTQSDREANKRGRDFGDDINDGDIAW